MGGARKRRLRPSGPDVNNAAMISVSPLYAGLVALLFFWLSVRVIFGRFLHRVSVGDGGEKDMVKRMRNQANCAEYAPPGIILLVLAELQGLPVWALHSAGIAFLLGRVVHAYGFGVTPQIILLRRTGMILTFATIVVLALVNIGMSLT